MATFGNNEQITDPAAGVRTSQLIAFAMIAGVVAFGAVVQFVQAGHRSPQRLDMMLGVMGVLLVGAIACGVIIPRSILGRAMGKCQGQARDAVERAMTPAYVMASVLRAALFEGPGLFGVMVVLSTGSPLGYIGAALSVMLLAATFPTRAKLEALMEQAMGVRMP